MYRIKPRLSRVIEYASKVNRRSYDIAWKAQLRPGPERRLPQQSRHRHRPRARRLHMDIASSSSSCDQTGTCRFAET
jgi:hypothetical protein